MQVTLYGYKLDFNETYLRGSKMIHYINTEASSCAEKLLKIYSSITTLNELLDFGQILKEKIYFDTVEKLLKTLDRDYETKNINKVSFSIECPKYWGKFEIVFSDILDKYIGEKNEPTISNRLSTLDATSLATLFGGKPAGSLADFHRAYGILRSMQDGAGAGNSSINREINENMKIVLRDPGSIQALSSAIVSDIMNLVPLLSRHIYFQPQSDGDVDVNEDVSPPTLDVFHENFRRAALIADKIQSNGIPKEKLKPFLAQLIYLAPFEPKHYAIPYYIFGDNDGELEGLANSLDVDIDFSDYRKAEENAKDYFGFDYDDMELQLAGNMFYKQTKDLLGSAPVQLANECRFLFNQKLQQFFLSPLDPENSVKCDEICALYGCFDRLEENALLIFDNNKSIFGRDGFILTNKNIYFYVGAIFRLSEITSFSFSSLNFIINKQNIPMLWENLNEGDLSEIHDFLFFFLKVRSYMKKFEHPYPGNELPLSQKAHGDVLQYAQSVLGIFNDDDLKVTVTSLSNNPYIKKKFHNAISNYANLVDGEIPLLCYDNTAFGSAKEGCLVTTKGIHVHNSFLKPQSFFFGEISSIEINRSVPYKIFINDYELQAALLSTNDAKVRFCSLLNRIMHDYTTGHQQTSPGNQKEKPPAMSRALIENVVNVINHDVAGSEMQKFVHAYAPNPKIQKKFSNAINSYASLDEDEIPVACFDNTLFGSAKEGCMITTTSIHIHNILSKPERLYFRDIKSISLRDPLQNNLFINDIELQTTNLSSHESKVKFCKLLNYILDNIRQQ